MKHVHFTIPEETYDKLKRIFPEHGALTILMRGTLYALIVEYEKSGKTASALEDKAREVVNDAIERGIV